MVGISGPGRHRIHRRGGLPALDAAARLAGPATLSLSDLGALTYYKEPLPVAEVIEDAAHMTNLEEPEMFNNALLTFLRFTH